MNEVEALRQEIRDFIVRHHLTYTEYCAGTKLNPSVLSAFLRDAYGSAMYPRTVLKFMRVLREKRMQYEE